MNNHGNVTYRLPLMVGLPRIFYLMGPSGAGKDSVIKRCRACLQTEHRCMVAHRYITRTAAAGGENHIELSQLEFQQRVSGKVFSMYWQANGHYYGIGCEILRWLDSGFNVIVNGSRAYLPAALNCFNEMLVPVCLNVSPIILRKRLRERGRESPEEIASRIKRAAEYTPASSCLHLDNSGSLDSTVKKLLKLIESCNS